MTIRPQREDVPDPLAEQHALADCLGRLGARLQLQDEADPVLVMETALAALALTRTWLELHTVRAALASVAREQLDWWVHELVEDEAYVGRIREAVCAELRVSLPGGNGHRPHLLLQRGDETGKAVTVIASAERPVVQP